MSTNSLRDLRVAVVYQNRVVHDRTFSSGEVTIGTEAGVDIPLPPIGLSEGFQLFQHRGDGFVLRLTDAVDGELHLKKETQPLQQSLKSRFEAKGSVKSLKPDQNVSEAKLFETRVGPGDWGIIRLGDAQVVFQFVLPRAAVARAASFGGFTGMIAALVAALFSVTGIAFLLSVLLQSGFLFWAYWTDDTKEDLKTIQLDERWVQLMTDVKEEQEEEEIVKEDKPDDNTEEEIAKEEDDKFEEVDPRDQEESELDVTLHNVVKTDKPVGIQAAMSDKLLGAQGAASLFGGQSLGDAMDQMAIGPDGGYFNAGFGYGAMGMGRGAGGGGAGGRGAGQIGGLVDRGGGGGDGPSKGLGKKTKVKVKPKLALEASTQSQFCRPENIKKVVSSKASALRNCYERQLLAEPDLAGKIVMSWKIGTDGSVMDVFVKTSTMKNDKVEGCMERQIKRFKFDPPDGGVCIIEFPFVFSPSE